MIFFGISLILFGIVIIAYPQIIAYMIGRLIILIGISIVVFRSIVLSKTKSQDGYVKFGNYKIFKD